MTTQLLKASQRIRISENTDYSEPSTDFVASTEDTSIVSAEHKIVATSTTITAAVTNIAHFLQVQNKSATAAEIIDIWYYDYVGSKSFSGAGATTKFTLADATDYWTLTDGAVTGTFVTDGFAKAGGLCKLVGTDSSLADGIYPLGTVAAKVLRLYDAGTCSAVPTYGTLYFLTLNHIALAAGASCAIPLYPNTDMAVTFTPRSGTPQIEYCMVKLA
jgi:hypothetical protein